MLAPIPRLCQSYDVLSVTVHWKTYIVVKKDMWLVYKHTGKGTDYEVYKEAKTQQQMKLESISDILSTN